MQKWSAGSNTTPTIKARLRVRNSMEKAATRNRGYHTSSLFFFFQAEDGIRDLTVTGVQTCALPIYPTNSERVISRALRTGGVGYRDLPPLRGTRSLAVVLRDPCRHSRPTSAPNPPQIGRASCRERV